jgi:hypothetical protein
LTLNPKPFSNLYGLKRAKEKRKRRRERKKERKKESGRSVVCSARLAYR